MKKKIIEKVKKLKSHFDWETLMCLRFALITIFCTGLLMYVFLLKGNNDLFLFALILLWILVVKLYNFKSRITFKIIVISLLVLSALFIVVPGESYTEQLTTLIYLLFIVGIFQQWKESR